MTVTGPSFVPSGRAAAPAPGREPSGLAEVMEELRRRGSRTPAQLVIALNQPSRARLLSGGGTERVRPSEVTGRLRELDLLGWVMFDGERAWLTEAGDAVLGARRPSSPAHFAVMLCVRHETENKHVVTRLLERLWELGPDGEGTVEITRPPIADVLAHTTGIAPRLRRVAREWWLHHALSLRGAMSHTPPDDVLVRVEAIVRGGTTTVAKHVLRRRVEDALMDALHDALFGDIVGPRELATWQRRLDRAGFALVAQGMPGQVWFPTGVFSAVGGADLVPVRGLLVGATTWHVRVPHGAEAEERFARTLYDAYKFTRVMAESEYVSLLTVRDLVCHRLRVGNPAFELLLQAVLSKALRGDLPYAMALEVDQSPLDRRRNAGALEVTVDGLPRYIIAMRHRAPTREDES